MTTPSARQAGRKDFAGRLRALDALNGLILKMPCPAFVEMAAYLGFDLVVLDAEHGAGDTLALEHHLRAAEASGIAALVRVGELNTTLVQAALDAGANGVVVPHVSSGDAAASAAAMAHYPPHGARGLALTTRAGRQGTASLATHMQRAAESTVVVVQIEDPEGAGNAAEICETRNVDGIWLGRNDLALAAADTDDVAALEADVVTATCSSRKPLMVIAGSRDEAAAWRSRGASVVLFGVHALLAFAARELLA